MLWVLGAVLLVAGALMALLRGTVIRYWTSRYLGSLAPGYAASRIGVLVYAGLVADLGLLLLALAAGSPLLLVASIAIFIAASVVVFVGEWRTYRALKR